MLLVNEDVRDRALVGHLLQRILNRGAIVCRGNVLVTLPHPSPIAQLDIPTWSSSMIYAFAPISLRSDLVALQYGQ